MNQKELEIQRALGTVNIYNIKICFPRGEELKGLDQLITKIIPSVTRFYNGSGSIFAVEMPLSYLELFIKALTKLIQDTGHNKKGQITWVYVHELVDSKYLHIRNFLIE